METNFDTLHDRLERYRVLLSLNTDKRAADALKELIADITAQLCARERLGRQEQPASASGSARA